MSEFEKHTPEKYQQLKFEVGEIYTIPQIEEFKTKGEDFEEKFREVASEIAHFDLKFSEGSPQREKVKDFLAEGSHQLFLGRGKDKEIIGYALYQEKNHYLKHIEAKAIGHDLRVSYKRKIRTSLIEGIKEKASGYLWTKNYDNLMGENDIGALMEAGLEINKKDPSLYLFAENKEKLKKLNKIIRTSSKARTLKFSQARIKRTFR